MKRQIILLSLIVLSNVINLFGQYSEPARVHDIVVAESYFDYVPSRNDKFAYSPSKVFDNNPMTCMAINYNQIKENGGYFFKFEFDRRNIGFFDKNIDRIIIEPGFFNPAYYKKNARIKKINIVIAGFGENYGKYYKDTFILEDKMEAQVLLLKERVKKIWWMEFNVEEIYPGETWQDVCLSGIKLFDGNYELKMRIIPKRNIHIQWYYDDKDQLTMSYWHLLYERNVSGMMIIEYKDKRISKLKVFGDSFGEEGNEIHKPVYWEYFYVYNHDNIIIIDGNNTILREYKVKDGKIIQEKRIRSFPRNDSNDNWIFNYHQDGKDDIREYIRQENSILRLVYSPNEKISEIDYYEENVIIYSYRDSHIFDIFPPIEYIFLK
jgi:hypothetical protein